MADEVFRTDDMTLVAVLVMNRHRYQLEVVQQQGGRKRANWVFDTDEKLLAIVEEYNATSLKVEPQIFVRTLAKVRGEMYRSVPPERELRPAASA